MVSEEPGAVESKQPLANPTEGGGAVPNIYTLEILRIIKETQQQHGLRHGDYQRYRGYCTRRVRRLRKVLKLPQGDKRHYKKRDVQLDHIEGKRSDMRYLHVPLMMAERAWSYAMQLRQESNTEPRKRFHLVSKLRKACVYALLLQELVQSEVCDARSKLEAEAYVAWMHGTLHFELSSWKTAAENLKRAQVVYENLIQALPDEEQTLYKAKVDELTPSLRYCAYNIGDGGGSIDDLIEMRAQGLLENLDSLVSQTKIQTSETLQTTEWRGRKVTVRPEKVRLFLLSIQELEKSMAKAKTNQAKIEIIENVLMDCKDAIASVKDELKQDPKLRTPSQDGLPTGMQYLLAYLTYIRHIRTLERNMYLVAQAKPGLDSPGTGEGKKVRPQDLTRLYEIILQNVAELQQIAGLETEASYQSEIETLQSSFRAFRCYYIAVTLVVMKRWREAVAMYERSTKYALDALKSKPTQFNLSVDLQELVTTIGGCKFSAHAYSVLDEDMPAGSGGVSGGDVSYLLGSRGGKSASSTRPLFERLSEYKEDQQLNSKNPNVYKMTPDMEPVSCKPLFFDLAFNFIRMPNIEDRVEVANTAGKKAAGISGFVKGFLGWGGGSGSAQRK